MQYGGLNPPLKAVFVENACMVFCWELYPILKAFGNNQYSRSNTEYMKITVKVDRVEHLGVFCISGFFWGGGVRMYHKAATDQSPVT